MTKNAFHMMKALFILKIFKSLSQFFGHLGKWLNKKAKGNFKIYDITDGEAITMLTLRNISCWQYWQSGIEIWSDNKIYNVRNIFFQNSSRK